MRYKIVKDVELGKDEDKLMNATAQSMLILLVNRLCLDKNSDYVADEEFDVDYDFSMYGSELKKIRQEKGYSNEKIIQSAERFVSKL